MSNPPLRLDNVGGGDSRPADQVGKWIYSQLDFKEAIILSKEYVDDPNVDIPFSEVDGPKGNREWIDDKRIELEEATFSNGGALEVHMAAGWEAKFYLWSANDDYFEDIAEEAGESYKSSQWVSDDSWAKNMRDVVDAKLEGKLYPTIWVDDEAEFADSRAAFVMRGGDYFGFDVDADYDTISQAKIKLDGVNFVGNTAVDDRLQIKMVWLRKWDANYPSQNEIDGVEPTIDPICEEGFHLEDGVCVPDTVGLVCEDGWHEEGGVCVKDEDPNPHNCQTGYIWDSNLQMCVKQEGGGGGGDDVVIIPPINYGLFGLIAVSALVGYIVVIAVRGGMNG